MIEQIEHDGQLIKAAMKGDSSLVEKLLKTGVVINIPNKDGKTPLHCACMSGNYGITKMLVEHGAEINVLDKQGNSPLHYACLEGNYGMTKMLVKRGAEMDLQQNPPSEESLPEKVKETGKKEENHVEKVILETLLTVPIDAKLEPLITLLNNPINVIQLGNRYPEASLARIKSITQE